MLYFESSIHHIMFSFWRLYLQIFYLPELCGACKLGLSVNYDPVTDEYFIDIMLILISICIGYSSNVDYLKEDKEELE